MKLYILKYLDHSKIHCDNSDCSYTKIAGIFTSNEEVIKFEDKKDKRYVIEEITSDTLLK